MPIKVESKDVFIKMIFSGAVVHDEAGMNHTTGDGVAFEDPFCPRLWMLHELDLVALRIFHPEAAASIFQTADRIRNFDAIGYEIAAQRGAIVSAERNVVQAVCRLCIRSRTVAHPLHASRSYTDKETLRLPSFNRSGRRQAQHRRIEMLVGVRRGSIKSHMINPSNLRTLVSRLRQRRGNKKRYYAPQSSFHRASERICSEDPRL